MAKDVLAKQDVEAHGELKRMTWVISTRWRYIFHAFVKHLPSQHISRGRLSLETAVSRFKLKIGVALNVRCWRTFRRRVIRRHGPPAFEVSSTIVRKMNGVIDLDKGIKRATNQLEIDADTTEG